MSLTLSIAVFFTIWWTVLFAILPFGVRSLHEEGGGPAGSDPGAPVNPRLGAKALWTTAVSCVVFGVVWLVAEYASLDPVAFGR
jgi:predicted secreted protein